MAVTSLMTKSQLRLVFERGLDEYGNPVYKNKNFNNVKTEVSVEDLYEVASQLASLQIHPLSKVEQNNSYEIMEM